jgi:hypothetical protein
VGQLGEASVGQRVLLAAGSAAAGEIPVKLRLNR